MTLSIPVWLLLATIWGSTWLFIKIGLEDLPPISFAGIRFVVASLPLVTWVAIRRLSRSSRLSRESHTPHGGMNGMNGIKRRDLWLMVWTGWLTFTVNYALVFWGRDPDLLGAGGHSLYHLPHDRHAAGPLAAAGGAAHHPERVRRAAGGRRRRADLLQRGGDPGAAGWPRRSSSTWASTPSVGTAAEAAVRLTR